MAKKEARKSYCYHARLKAARSETLRVFVHKIACLATLFCIKIPAKNILFTGL